MNSDNQIDSKYECSICQMVLTSPYSIKECGHNFCKNCIQSLLSFAKSAGIQ